MRNECLHALHTYAVLSLPILMLTAGFTGIIMVLQGAMYMRQYGAEALVGWYTGFTTLREVGPLLMGLMFSGRVGAQHTSELASMRASEQLDVLRVLALNIYSTFILPRLIAMLIAMLGLVILGNAVALLCGAMCSYFLLHIQPLTFLNGLQQSVHASDLILGLVKTAFNALSIGLLATYFGLSAKPASSGIGEAVQHQVVTCAICLFLIDAGVNISFHASFFSTR